MLLRRVKCNKVLQHFSTASVQSSSPRISSFYFCTNHEKIHCWLDSYVRMAAVVYQISLRQDLSVSYIAIMFTCNVCKDKFHHDRGLRKHVILKHRLQFNRHTDVIQPFSMPEEEQAAYLRYRRGQLSARRRHLLDAGLYVKKSMKADRHNDDLPQSCPPPRQWRAGPGRSLPSLPTAAVNKCRRLRYELVGLL